jgi:hypothetical protein
VRPLVYRAVAEDHKMTQQNRHSVVSFTVPSRIPVERVEFIPSGTGNFSRSVLVEAAPASGGKPVRFSGSIFRVHTVRDRIVVDQEQYALEIDGYIPPIDSGLIRWTVTVDNGDDAPLAFDTVRLAMRERQLCFDADSGAAYVVYYGDSTLAAPQYDYASLFQPSDHPQQATVDVEHNNPTFHIRPDTRPFTERHPALLWAALIVVILCLGAIALRSVTP